MGITHRSSGRLSPPLNSLLAYRKTGNKMKKTVSFTVFIFILLPFVLFADQSESDSFKDYVSYEIGANLLFLDPVLAEKASVIKESTSNEYAVVSFPIAGKNAMSVKFDPGPSDDPTFVISFKGKTEFLGGEKLYISSGGFLYLQRENNEHFVKKMKYSISDGEVKEVKQPFYLVDLKCRTSAALLLYENKCNKGSLIARLPKGAAVNILAIENIENNCPSNIIKDNETGDPVNSYLVSTPFGLVGWAVSSVGSLSRPGKPIECLRFKGD